MRSLSERRSPFFPGRNVRFSRLEPNAHKVFGIFLSVGFGCMNKRLLSVCIDATPARLYNGDMKYLTQILDKRVLSPDGGIVGKVVDTIADLEGRLPAVRAILVRTKEGELCLPFDALEFDADPRGPEGSGHIRGDIRLRAPLAGIAPCIPYDDALRLRRDILDKQIVDVQDYRVVRVNDVRLAEVGSGYCVVGRRCQPPRPAAPLRSLPQAH